MKSLVFIVSIYFLFLAVLPCHCETQVMNSFAENTEQISQYPTDYDFTQEICTPFCACSNHHNPNFITNYNIAIRNISLNVKHMTVYTDSAIPSYTSSLWRPPQA